ncbi:MAG: hypothetical protein ACREJ6_04995, partial [Candidatus Methylomirabilis sp.]
MKTNSVLDGRQESETLDLTYLTTGHWQHVFAKTGDPHDIWVYKIPAAFGYIVLTKPTDRILWPRTRFQTLLDLVLTSLPSALCKEVHRLAPHIDGRHSPTLAIASKPLTFLAQSLRSVGFKLVAAYGKPMRRRTFRRMLELLQYLVARGLSDILLPFEIVRDGRATLRVDGAAADYMGPILLQRKAAILFEKGESFKCFDWTEFIDAEHSLWRHGVGLSNWRDVLGPWALLDGHVRLFDTSGLTKDYQTARRQL